jgi:N6-adenosine-specific RNA methylase IME4
VKGPRAGDARPSRIALAAVGRGETLSAPESPTVQGRGPAVPNRGELVLYDAACRAVAAAKSVNELMQIRDQARALAACARVAKNRDMEADAVALRLRATRRLDQLRQEQKQTVGLATGGEHGGRPTKDGVRKTPSIVRPTLAMQGIDKNLAKQARVLGALSDEKFETVVADARDKVVRAVRNAVREVEIEQERESYRARTEEGCTVADLESLIGKIKFGVMAGDFPWPFEVYSDKGKQRSAERHYDTMSRDEIMAMAPLIKQLAADHCALFPWAVWPEHPGALEFIKACGFEYKTAGFIWIKTTKNAEVIALDGKGLHWGEGKTGTRSNTECCLLATRGSPMRLSKDVHQVVIAPVGEHSEKPDEVYKRIERLYPGPYLELFARKPRPHWTVWGDEIPRGKMTFGEAPKRSVADQPASAQDDYPDLPECLRRSSPTAKGSA